jgi:AcrR family transcriptional regulator
MIKIIVIGAIRMRCSPAHKARTRHRILASAHRLFASRGYAAASIDEIMRDCGLTRGGFYAYFRSKSELYREAMRHEAAPEVRDDSCDSNTWVQVLLDVHLEAESRLAFFATDVANGDAQVRAAYTESFVAMSRRIFARVRADAPCDEDATLALAAMIVGAAAIARSTDDENLKSRLAEACRRSAGVLVDPSRCAQPLTFFWAASREAAGRG